MITTKRTVTIPRLKISYDPDPESPREWSNLGYFIVVSNRYASPDKNSDIERIVRETAEVSTGCSSHMRNIKDALKDMGERVLYITPVTTYEHGSVVYKRGEMKGWDYSTNGFYIVTDKSAKETGAKLKEFEKIIDQELEAYTTWANGEVYGYTLYDESGEIEDSCYGFYAIEDIREHLPVEFKDEDLMDYIKY